jgi:DNA-binding NarL/FixJ family response regulator
MTSVMVVADSGDVMASLTSSLAQIAGVQIVRHANGRAPLGPLAVAHDPDVVVIGSMSRPAAALRCVRELHATAPAVQIIVLSSDARVGWLGTALQEGAAAVVPGDVDATTLGLVLRDLISAESSVEALAA